MNDLATQKAALATCQQYQTLLAVAEAIVAHRDLQALLHDLAGRLHEVVRFDHIVLVRYDPENNLMHRHVFDRTEPLPADPPVAFTVEDDPGGLVLQTQQPLILSALADVARWPLYLQCVQRF